ncbi:MAG: metallophosphoesterase [Deltaproteobacteria bacterium]|nr:metallophosphoesterase [Deltaproteobacteria bacterium]
MSAQRVFDRRYPKWPAPGRQAIASNVDRLLSPTLGFPELVQSGAVFEAHVELARAPDGRPIVPDVGDWLVYLVSAEGTAYRCTVEQVRAEGRFAVAKVRVALDLARDVYDLRVVTRGIDEYQPLAVRVLGRQRGQRFRLAVLSDHQLWDPSYRLSGRELSANLYTHEAKTTANEAIALQGLHELRLLDPDIVLHSGDLLYGLNYPQEYDEVYRLLRRARLPMLAVPGNHDAYAIYTVKLRGSRTDLLKGAVLCRQHFSKDGVWTKVWAFIQCVYGDVRKMFYADLQDDGLAYWHRWIGPTDYALSYRGFRVVGLNSYGGSPRRRHAFSVYVDAFDLHLGAPAVDNYGGYLSAKQLAFVAAEAERARKNKETLLVLAHHDPRGWNESGKYRYHPNESFPTDPFSGGGFEQWNYDSKQWDSDQQDKRSAETPSENSGVALLRILARYGGYYLSGHKHSDQRTVYPPGSKLGAVTVSRRLEFIRTTTAASSVDGAAYWGYRVLEAEDGKIVAADYAPQHGLGSVPTGNLWTRFVDKKRSTLELGSSLPRETTVRVRWVRAMSAKGDRFHLDAASAVGVSLKIDDVVDRKGQRVYWLAATLPAAGYPPAQRSARRAQILVAAAEQNQPPRVVIEVSRAGRHLTSPAAPAAGAMVAVDAAPIASTDARLGEHPVYLVTTGEHFVVDASRSSDADGDAIVRRTWTDERGRQWSGSTLPRRYTSPGKYLLTHSVVDATGLVAHGAIVVDVQPPSLPARRGCCNASVSATSRVGSAGIVVLLLWCALRRPRRRKRS